MNLPNKLTVVRVLLIIPFVVIMVTNCIGEYSKWVALALFCIASITDTLDGFIARKYNLVTNFGKFMDPLADKLLVCAALVCLVEQGFIPAWIVIIIMSREFIISGFRLVAADKGVVIAASIWGKIKTIVQMVMIIMLIADFEELKLLADIVMYVATALTIISLVDYTVKNKEVMAENE